MNAINVYVTNWAEHIIPADIWEQAGPKRYTKDRRLDTRTKAAKRLAEWAHEQDKRMTENG